jgi:hypothetical protein
MFLCHCLGLTKGSLQARGTCICFVTSQFLHLGVVSASPNPQAGGPALVVFPRLLIQYTRIYLLNQRLFLHPQPEDTPCLGDRDPLLVATATCHTAPSTHTTDWSARCHCTATILTMYFY